MSPIVNTASHTLICHYMNVLDFQQHIKTRPAYHNVSIYNYFKRMNLQSLFFTRSPERTNLCVSFKLDAYLQISRSYL